MSIKTRKSKRKKFGYFKNEKTAWDRIKHHKKYTPFPKGVVENYFVLKVKRPKDGLKSWLAYCLYTTNRAEVVE
jgi:hypothetical protein